MKIEEIQINRINSGQVVAQAKINFGWFWLSGFKVVKGEEKEYVTAPSYKSGYGWKPLFTTIKKTDWEQIQEAVLDKYEEGELDEYFKDK